MAVFIAWGNIQQTYSFQDIPADLLPEQLRIVPQGNSRVLQRYECRKLAHFLLWQLCKTAQIPTALLAQIYRTESGRPQFPVNHIDFNITHSGDWVAVVLNVVEQGDCAVGIDIEFPKKTRNFAALLAHFAAENEIQWFEQQENPEQAFYRIWCLREALLKSQGVGIVKLSEVAHDPVNFTLNSAYCPQGELVFTHELPFYLATFSSGDGLRTARYFQLTENRLQAVDLQSAVNYLVNNETIL